MHVSLSGKIKVSRTPTTEDIECTIGGICLLLLSRCMHAAVGLFLRCDAIRPATKICLAAHLLVNAGPWDLIEFIETANPFCVPYCKELQNCTSSIVYIKVSLVSKLY